MTETTVRSVPSYRPTPSVDKVRRAEFRALMEIVADAARELAEFVYVAWQAEDDGDRWRRCATGGAACRRQGPTWDCWKGSAARLSGSDDARPVRAGNRRRPGVLIPPRERRRAMSLLMTRRARELADLSAAGWTIQRYRPVSRRGRVSGLRWPVGRWSR